MTFEKAQQPLNIVIKATVSLILPISSPMALLAPGLESQMY